jgi:hypothetical protein
MQQGTWNRNREHQGTGGRGLWTYPAEPPEEPYAYTLDDEGMIYNPNSLWPFWTPKSGSNGHKSNPAVIRIAPDTHYQAWGQEHIMLGDRATLREAGVSFHISIEPKGLCQGWIISLKN